MPGGYAEAPRFPGRSYVDGDATSAGFIRAPPVESTKRVRQGFEDARKEESTTQDQSTPLFAGLVVLIPYWIATTAAVRLRRGGTYSSMRSAPLRCSYCSLCPCSRAGSMVTLWQANKYPFAHGPDGRFARADSDGRSSPRRLRVVKAMTTAATTTTPPMITKISNCGRPTSPTRPVGLTMAFCIGP